MRRALPEPAHRGRAGSDVRGHRAPAAQGFGEARASAPCVLFLDELDAFAYARRKQQGSAGRALVDQLLQELDAIGSDNRGLLVLAATNAPWDVDDALKRPGRFDRVVFVPPPDAEARLRILTLALAAGPSATSTSPPSSSAPRCSAAPICTRSSSARSTRSSTRRCSRRRRRPDLAAAPRRRPRRRRATTADWLRAARNYVEFANDAGRYDEVQAYLERRDVRKHVKRAV